jgi:predicted secreted protein
MAETKARIGYGAKVYIEASPFGANAAPLVSAMELVGELTSLSEPSRSKDTVDATHMGSPDRYREFIAGLKDGGEVPLEGNRVQGDDGQTALEDAFEYDGSVYVVLEIPTVPAVRWTLKGILTSREGETPLDDKMTFSASLKVTGKPSLAPVV